MLRTFKTPVIFIAVIWLVFIIDVYLHLELGRYGIYPRMKSGLIGIVSAPFLHGNYQHIVSNTFILFVLLSTISFFYKNIAWGVILLSILLGGFLIWVFGRQAYHVGASGLIYSLAAFLIATGIFKGTLKSIIIALVIMLLYGGLVYGVFPGEKGVSWEGHLFGAVAGVLVAYIYRFNKE